MNKEKIEILKWIFYILENVPDKCYHCTFTSDFYYYDNLEMNRIIWKTLFEDWFIEGMKNLGFKIEFGCVGGEEYRKEKDGIVHGEYVDIGWDKEWNWKSK